MFRGRNYKWGNDVNDASLPLLLVNHGVNPEFCVNCKM